MDFIRIQNIVLKIDRNPNYMGREVFWGEIGNVIWTILQLESYYVRTLDILILRVKGPRTKSVETI